jgi:hypothetical protein
MSNIFYIIGVVAVVLFVAGYFGLSPGALAKGVPDVFQTCPIVDGNPSRVSVSLSQGNFRRRVSLESLLRILQVSLIQPFYQSNPRRLK